MPLASALTERSSATIASTSIIISLSVRRLLCAYFSCGFLVSNAVIIDSLIINDDDEKLSDFYNLIIILSSSATLTILPQDYIFRFKARPRINIFHHHRRNRRGGEALFI